MSTDSEEGRIVASLALRVKHVTDIDQVADVIITMLRDTDAALVPIIGPKGVAALYRRSLHLSKSRALMVLLIWRFPLQACSRRRFMHLAISALR